MRRDRCRDCGEDTDWHCRECGSCPFGKCPPTCSAGRWRARTQKHDDKTCTVCGVMVPVKYLCSECGDFTFGCYGVMKWDRQSAVHTHAVDEDAAALAVAHHQERCRA